MSKRQQIISSIVMGSAVTALSVTNVQASQPAQINKLDPSSNLVAQATPTQQPLVPNPRITIENAPTMPRAIAPPVGDISVSNMNGIVPQVNLNSNKLYSITANQSAREILRQIAFEANLNVVDTDNLTADGKPTTTPDKVISVRFRNEPIQNVFNNVLQLSGMEASRTGNTIFVSMKLPESAKETVVRSLRLNQITTTAASTFLSTQGAEVLITVIKEGKPELITLKAPPGDGVLVLRGLSISSDDRLNAITLVGSATKVEMATSMLTRLDARRRQVALNVKIVDVNLSNANLMNNSLSFKVGDGFLSVDKGAAVYNYGGYNPATNAQTLNSPTTPPIGALNLPGGSQPFVDYSPNANLSGQTSGGSIIDPLSGLPIARNIGTTPRPGFGTSDNPYQPGVTAFTPGSTGYVISPSGQIVPPGGQLTPANGTTPATFNTSVPTLANYTYALPTNYQIPTKFLSTLQAQIISGNGKILTDPTLVVQEGQKSTVNLTQEVFGGFSTKANSVGVAGSTTTREPIIKQAGLSLEILVNRIDDNGYVSVGVSPTVSSIGSTVSTADGDIALLQSRTLNSGEIRLRDGQTLILSGIIQESDRTSVTKVPILGDIPILGALFRSTNKTNQRQEVVVLLTPQILNDDRGQVNYTPGVDARLMIGK